MDRNWIVKNLCMLLSGLTLIGCDSDSNSDTDYSDIELARVSGKPLTTTDAASFERFLKNGIRVRLSYAGDDVLEGDYAVPADSADSTGSDTAAESDGDTGSGDYSTTNLHEAGVDEADRVKYDGEHLFVVTSAYSNGYYETEDTLAVDARDSMPAPENLNNAVRILRTDSDTASAEEIARIESAEGELSFSSLYLRGGADQLVTLSNAGYYGIAETVDESDWSWNNGKVELRSFDISDAANPAEEWKLELEGYLNGSRRIGDTLYVVTRYMPNIPGLNYYTGTASAREDNEKLINDTPLADLLPHYQANDGEVESLVSASDCLVPEDIEPNQGYADLVTLTAINLDTHAISSAVCLNTNVQGLYSSQSGFYIGATSYESWYDSSHHTAVHKFALDSGSIDYRASADVPGYLGWDDPAFRMDEVDDDLRIVTTDFQDWDDPLHQLTILREDGDSRELMTVSTLPNDEHSDPIGKPGENIYAVRFTNERAYIVTFETIDPLYVLDLSDHDAPVIAGELEIPGFSRYLHPVESGWLLGIGQEVVNGRSDGIKAELFDVRDMSAPQVANKIVIGGQGSYSEVLYDLRALSFLHVDQDTKRLAFPVDVWQPGSSYSSTWIGSGLFAFDLLRGEDDAFELSISGELIAETPSAQQNYPQNTGRGRSVIHNDAVFYVHGDDVYSDTWGSWHNPQGPM